MKKYALVRVDRICPKVFSIENYYKKEEKKKMFYCKDVLDCKDCRYGDTKEQLVRKVVQVLKRETGNDGVFISNGRNFQDSKSVFWEDIAKEIVEFLGVKE